MEKEINLSAYPAINDGNMEQAKAAVEAAIKELKELREEIDGILFECDGATQFKINKLLNGMGFNLESIQIAVTDVPEDIYNSNDYAEMCATH